MGGMGPGKDSLWPLPAHLTTLTGNGYVRKKDTMDEQGILHRIQSLVEEERELREKAEAQSGPDRAPDRARLERLEQDLDQAWDLLRQRRAKRQYGENPNEAQPRPVKQVEDYSG
jgi:hypothetical protein